MRINESGPSDSLYSTSALQNLKCLNTIWVSSFSIKSFFPLALKYYAIFESVIVELTNTFSKSLV
jgi:hypothetical protein